MSITEATEGKTETPGRRDYKTPDFLLLADSPADLEIRKDPTPKEQKNLRDLKGLIMAYESIFNEDYSQLQKKLQTNSSEEPKPPEQRFEEGLKEIAWLVGCFQEYKRQQGESDFALFDEQLLALIRLLDHKVYKKAGIKGLIEELKTGEGKTSVVIPVFLAWLGLHEENIHIHEVNPYLLTEGFNNFYNFANFLGIGDQVGKIDEFPKIPENKRFIFGYWSDFIHWQQYYFLKTDEDGKRIVPDFPKKPFLVLDEIDQLLQDEGLTPAIISEQILTNDYLEGFLQELREGIGQPEDGEKEQVSEPFRFSYKFDNQEISVSLDPKNYKEEIKTPEAFVGEVVNFLDWLEKIEPLIEQEIREQGKKPDLQTKREFLTANFDYYFLYSLIMDEIETKFGKETSLKLQQDKDFIRSFKKSFNQSNFSFWWNNSMFEVALVQAFLMKPGRDYIIKQKSNQETLADISLILKKLSSEKKFLAEPIKIPDKKIIPLAQASGYPEQGKSFQELVQLFLFIKEQIKQSPDSLQVPLTLTKAIDQLYTFEFYQQFDEVYGFTGTAAGIARRLKAVYDLETTAIPQRFANNRIDHPMILKNSFDEVKEEAVEKVKQDKRNTLLVVDSWEQAQELLAEFKQGNIDDNVEISVLWAGNSHLDQQLYDWISGKDQASEKRRVLITVKMVGRGVDLKPTDRLKQDGLLLVSLTPFLYERSFKQLIGRIGRREEKGETFIFVSADDPVFDSLSTSDRKKLEEYFKQPEKNRKKIEKLIKKAWENREDDTTYFLKGLSSYSKQITFLRRWLQGEVNLSPDRKNENDFRQYILENWSDLLWYLNNTFGTWSTAGQGPFSQGGVDNVWDRFISETLKNYYQNFLRKKEN